MFEYKITSFCSNSAFTYSEILLQLMQCILLLRTHQMFMFCFILSIPSTIPFPFYHSLFIIPFLSFPFYHSLFIILLKRKYFRRTTKQQNQFLSLSLMFVKYAQSPRFTLVMVYYQLVWYKRRRANIFFKLVALPFLPFVYNL